MNPMQIVGKDITYDILDYLNVQQISKFVQCDKHLSQLSIPETYWEKSYRQQFPNIPPLTHPWSKCYKETDTYFRNEINTLINDCCIVQSKYLNRQSIMSDIYSSLVTYLSEIENLTYSYILFRNYAFTLSYLVTGVDNQYIDDDKKGYFDIDNTPVGPESYIVRCCVIGFIRDILNKFGYRVLSD